MALPEGVYVDDQDSNLLNGFLNQFPPNEFHIDLGVGVSNGLVACETLARVLHTIRGRSIIDLVDSGDSSIVMQDLTELHNRFNAGGTWFVDLTNALAGQKDISQARLAFTDLQINQARTRFNLIRRKKVRVDREFRMARNLLHKREQIREEFNIARGRLID